jgi:hypothetical protein
VTRRHALALALALTSCADEAGDDPEVFIALQRDFADFQRWPVLWQGDGDTVPGHPAGARTVYGDVHADGEVFGAGSMLVKTIDVDPADLDPGAAAGPLVFAMVKRGGAFNPEANGWEWFELTISDDGQPLVVWRGEKPPNGECYGCTPGLMPGVDLEMASCTACHAGAGDNDLVYSVPLPR